MNWLATKYLITAALVVAFLLARIGFWPTLLASAAITFACFGITGMLVRPFGIQLLP